MSIVPAALLSSSDIALLGNNLVPPPRRRHGSSELAAVNRSLAGHGEGVRRLRRVPVVPRGQVAVH